MRAGDFTVSPRRGAGQAADDHASAARYFEYAPATGVAPPDMAARVSRALVAARTHAAKIHGVVLPELALSTEQFTAVEPVVTKAGAMLIAGVRGQAAAGHMPFNMCAI